MFRLCSALWRDSRVELLRCVVSLLLERLPRDLQMVWWVVVLVDDAQCYSPLQSITCVRNTARSKFNETFEVVANLNIDPKKTNQVVRGMLVVGVHCGGVPV